MRLKGKFNVEIKVFMNVGKLVGLLLMKIKFYTNKKDATLFETKEEAEKLIVGFDFLHVVESTTEISFTSEEIEFLSVFLGNFPDFPHSLWAKLKYISEPEENLISNKYRDVFTTYTQQCKNLTGYKNI